jgi:hypothetical protein
MLRLKGLFECLELRIVSGVNLPEPEFVLSSSHFPFVIS